MNVQRKYHIKFFLFIVHYAPRSRAPRISQRASSHRDVPEESVHEAFLSSMVIHRAGFLEPRPQGKPLMVTFHSNLVLSPEKKKA